MKKLKYKDVKNYIESFGYTLISKEYKGARKKLELQCNNGHLPYETTYDNFKRGKRCPYCYGNIKLKYKDIKNYIESFGYNLLSEKYKNAHTKLKVQCPEGHIYDVAFNSFKNGNRCPICKRGVPLSFEAVKKNIEKEGYQLLSKEYKNAQTYMKFKCPKGHIFDMYYNSFQQGRRCPVCNKIRKNNLQRYSYDFIKEQIEREGYQLLSKEYISVFKKLELKCPYGHIYSGNYHNFKHGKRCPVCNYNNLSSKAEKEIQEYCKSIYNGEIVNNNRNIIVNPLTGKNLELDVYFPWSKRAIEYDGDYWHSFPYQKEKDEIKREQCKKMGIDLLVIKEQDWIDNKEKCLNEIKNFIKM